MPTKSCPICAKRRGKRHCPGLARSRWAGKTETICAQCCGKQREAAIDCPLDCPYLLAAHRYEAERPTAAPAELAFPQVALARDFLEQYSQQHQQERGSSLRPGEVLRALVFLRRLGQRESNGRPLTRTFLNFLRAQLPAEAQATTPSAPPLIVPGR